MDYIRTYFECLKAAGMDTTLEINRMRGPQCIEKISFDHIQHDGISLILEVARKFPKEGFIPPAISVKPKPTFPKRLWELLKWYIRFYPFMPPKWKEFSKNQTQNANGKIEVEEWEKQSPYSLNTRLLLALDLTSREYLTNSDRPRVWMGPVGLYSKISRDLSPMNRVSFIDIEIKNSTSPIDTQANIKKQLSELNYWGTILTMTLPRLMGKKLFTAYGKIAHYTFRRTGTFTNLGAWTIPGLSPDEWWTFGKGATAKMSPVSGTAIIINGRLALSVHFDSSLGLTDEDAQCFVEKWKQNFLNHS